MQRVVTSIAAAVFTAVVLAGCTTADGSASSGPEGGHAASTAPATPTPTVMSDEEALQTGVETFERLMAAELKIYENPETAFAEIESLTTDNLGTYRQQLRDASTQPFTAHGQLKVHNAELQSAEPTEIVFYACVDLSTGYVTDPEGNVVGGDRRGKIGSFEVEVRQLDDMWKVHRKDHWSGNQRCS